MKYWLTTDTHFGHDKMEEYCGRPADFGNRIIDGLKIVNDDDVLIHLGDFCIGNDLNYHELFMNNVKGKKWLVKGNHDKKSNSWYLNHGWDWVGYHFRDKFFGKKITFSHIPIETRDYWDFNIHGHFHNTLHRLQQGNWMVEGEEGRNKDVLKILTKKHLLISIEKTDYKPVNLEKLLQINNKK